MANQKAIGVAFEDQRIIGGSIDSTVIGGTTPAAGTFTSVELSAGGSLNADSGTATATAGAATLSKMAGVVTSESLTTAAAATYTLTITNTACAAADIVFASVAMGTATTGEPVIATVTPGAGSLVILVKNVAAAAALNGTIKVSFMIIKP